MSADAATNKVTLPAYSHSRFLPGSTVNDAIPVVGGMEQWRSEAIQKVIGFGALGPNWDSHGSQTPSLAVRQTAIELLMMVPGRLFPAPRIIPSTGGGYHLEWSIGNRELEISIEPDCQVEALRVENGMPKEDGPQMELSALFYWLASL
ncbi:MAG: hypothetical protein ABI423_01310 [Burkholderiales bacterium]